MKKFWTNWGLTVILMSMFFGFPARAKAITRQSCYNSCVQSFQNYDPNDINMRNQCGSPVQLGDINANDDCGNDCNCQGTWRKTVNTPNTTTKISCYTECHATYEGDSDPTKVTTQCGPTVIPGSSDANTNCGTDCSCLGGAWRKSSGTGGNNGGGGTSTGNNQKDSKDSPCSKLGAGEAKCKECVQNEDNPQGFWTGIGCISTNPMKSISQVLGFLLGVSGFFILMQILIGAFKMTVSKGDPKGLQEAKERITASIIALLFIVFSVTILEFIGVSILKIPGFFTG